MLEALLVSAFDLVRHDEIVEACFESNTSLMALKVLASRSGVRLSCAVLITERWLRSKCNGGCEWYKKLQYGKLRKMSLQSTRRDQQGYMVIIQRCGVKYKDKLRMKQIVLISNLAFTRSFSHQNEGESSSTRSSSEEVKMKV